MFLWQAHGKISMVKHGKIICAMFLAQITHKFTKSLLSKAAKTV